MNINYTHRTSPKQHIHRIKFRNLSIAAYLIQGTTPEFGFTQPHVWRTVDGQNPAPPRMMIIPLFIGFWPSHQQYFLTHQSKAENLGDARDEGTQRPTQRGRLRHQIPRGGAPSKWMRLNQDACDAPEIYLEWSLRCAFWHWSVQVTPKWHPQTSTTQLPVFSTLTDSKTICLRNISIFDMFCLFYPNFHHLAIIEIARKKTNIENLPCKIDLVDLLFFCVASRDGSTKYHPTTSGWLRKSHAVRRWIQRFLERRPIVGILLDWDFFGQGANPLIHSERNGKYVNRSWKQKSEAVFISGFVSLANCLLRNALLTQ